ncbi:hypothetical protein [Streptomyces sp. NBRC 110611]|uniref:hypothetical protein n=1 Tax=Streptomyces sp. NBRC 110611 TaxID=1621259 RepID=UPI00285249D5|nr:hypothetical protein [Streptomyces sp. NBRC 110611]
MVSSFLVVRDNATGGRSTVFARDGIEQLRRHARRPLRVGRSLRARNPHLAQLLGHRRRHRGVPRGTGLSR